MSSVLPESLARLERLAQGQGFSPSRLSCVRFFRATSLIPRQPLMYEAGMIAILQGHKVGYLGPKRFRYDANNYLLMTIPLPLDCETHASPEKPFLALVIDFDRIMLSELLAQIDSGLLPPDEDPEEWPGVNAIPLSGGLAGAIDRVLQYLESDCESRVLGTQAIREIAFHVLRGPGSAGLRGLAKRDSRIERIARSMRAIHQDCAQRRSVDDLAGIACMSVSAFHRHFKAVTNRSPLQYLKQVRLHRAKQLIAHGGRGAGDAALEIGYESYPQFSREFKSYFGHSPSKTTALWADAMDS